MPLFIFVVRLGGTTGLVVAHMAAPSSALPSNSTGASEIEHQDPVAVALRATLDRELEGEPPAARGNDGVGGVEASVAIEVGEPLVACESVERQPPDVGRHRPQRALEIALDEDRTAVREDAFSLLVA